MNISAVNCTPIKPKVSFGDIEHSHRQLHDMADEYTSETVDGKDIKRPIAIVASLAALVGIAYGGGKKAASASSAIYKKVANTVKPIAKNSADDVAQGAKELGVIIEDGLKKASKLASVGIDKLRTVPKDEVTVLTSKKDVIKNKTADILEKGLALAKAGYKKVAYSGIADDVVGADRAQKAFENVAGAVGLATVVPEIVSRDANEDGVEDILQKSQNAYTSTEEKIAQVTKDLGVVTDIIQSLT